LSTFAAFYLDDVTTNHRGRIMRTLLWLFALAAPSFAFAQTDSVPHRERKTCWRGRPAPECDNFWLTEISAEYAFASTTAHYRQTYITPNGTYVVANDQSDMSSRLVWTVGPMFNTSPTTAVGGTVSAGFVSNGARIAIEARRRTWLVDGMILDLSTGVTRMPVPFTSNPRYGLTAGTYIGGSDLVHLSAHGDLLFSDGRPRAGATVGIGAGSYAAVGVTGVLGVLTAALIIALAHANWD
jgi:hypothetical protein